MPVPTCSSEPNRNDRSAAGSGIATADFRKEARGLPKVEKSTRAAGKPASITKRQPVHVVRGQRIYAADTTGTAWRVLAGSVRLDRQEPNGEQSFANLAVIGDILGAETLLFGRYTFTATALSACVLAPWPEGQAAPAGDSLLRTLAKGERRAAEVIGLRCGQAAERVRRLVMLLSHVPTEDPAANPAAPLQVVLPSRQDMADITALKLETVSRMVSQLRQTGILDPLCRDGHPSLRNFVVRGAAADPY